ncbi:pyrroline-5-carboxylate reductase [Phreatobacter sp. AB_2022a]|uniref:pyrroline-5-carboxylate reductase n=1 Tax=Phreatobacter sp. AB_2022a TaxID=3003134 RepID=UPI0022874822|nr:pyrroline-5-carboxylate reductase [Phreatobacter sp. AB_2022a]MCZ0735148.1 pyrroline-5-carboxylate reductase [Phreatobacter sp. AB_2022a]
MSNPSPSEQRETERPLQSFTGHLVLVGAGQMGGALLAGWFRLGLEPSRVTVIDPRPSDTIRTLLADHPTAINPPAAAPADVMVLAIKPQMADEVMPQVKHLVIDTTVVVSVMAGKTIARMEEVFGAGTAVVRTIPNTPAAVGRGITGAAANGHVTAAQRALVDTLLGAVGSAEWLEREDWIDAVTAVSGSGPAYVFLIAETLARAGAAAGLPADLAARLARATVEGAGELLYRSPAIPPATLRQNVTSPNGTTHAALQVLMAPDGVDPLFEAAVAAAAKRSRELAG